MSKKLGPKEAAMRQQREGNGGVIDGGGIDTESIKSRLKEMEERHKREREDEQLELLKPINDQIAFHQDQLEILRKLKADLTGKPMIGGVEVRQRAKRRSLTEKIAIAETIHDFLRENKGRQKASALKHLTEGLELSELVRLHNEHSKDGKIKHEGEKASREYFV